MTFPPVSEARIARSGPTPSPSGRRGDAGRCSAPTPGATAYRSEELEPDVVRVSNVDDALWALGEIEHQRDATPAKEAEPGFQLGHVEPDVVELRTRAERFVIGVGSRVVVQFESVRLAGIGELDEDAAVLHRSPQALAEAEGAIEPQRPRDVSDPDPGVEQTRARVSSRHFTRQGPRSLNGLWTSPICGGQCVAVARDPGGVVSLSPALREPGR